MDKSYGMLLQRALREIVDPSIVIDGDLGTKSLAALQKFAALHGLSAPNDFGDTPAMQLLASFVESKYVTPTVFSQTAKLLNVPESYVRAVAEVETREAAFLPSGLAVTLFERHKFYGFLKKTLTTSRAVSDNIRKKLGASDSVDAAGLLATMLQQNGDICNPSRGGYQGGEAEIARLKKAASFSPDDAYMSASYGGFQIMGFNYAVCGYTNAFNMFQAFCTSEQEQFTGFARFIKGNPAIWSALKAANWAKFAEGYNGSDYRDNKYDTKLAAAQAKWAYVDK